MAYTEETQPEAIKSVALSNADTALDLSLSTLDVYDHSILDTNYEWGEFLVRRATIVSVIFNEQVLFEKPVWQFGRVFPKPFYEQRLSRALKKAERFMGNLLVSREAELVTNPTQ